jgi:hypothetical protein
VRAGKRYHSRGKKVKRIEKLIEESKAGSKSQTMKTERRVRQVSKLESDWGDDTTDS